MFKINKKPEIVYDPLQEEIINTKGHIVVCTGRQWGKTLTFAKKAGIYMRENPNSRIIVVSLTEDQAQLMIIMTLDYLEQNNKDLIGKKKLQPTKNKIFLKNGSSMIARPVGNTGDAIRGFTGNVLIVDEASRMPDMMWAAAKPSLLTMAGEIWMCSTPYTKKGYFYESFINKHERFTTFHISSEQAMLERPISESWTKERSEGAKKMLAEERKDMSAMEYAQEYLGQFVDDLQQLFPDELIRKCMTEERRDRIIPEREYYLGMDIARLGNDDGTFEIIDKINNDNLIHIENQVTRKEYLTETAKYAIALNKRYDFAKIYLDDEGLGIAVFDMLIDHEETRMKTIGLRNSKKIIDWRESRRGKTAGRKRMMKEDLYMNLKALMEQGRIKLLKDPSVFLSFKSVQFEYTRDKTSRSYMRIFGNDTHIVEGLTRAAWCAKTKDLKLWISSI